MKRKLKKAKQFRDGVVIEWNGEIPTVLMKQHQNSYQLLATQYVKDRRSKEPSVGIMTLHAELRSLIMKSVGIQEHLFRKHKSGRLTRAAFDRMLQNMWTVS